MNPDPTEVTDVGLLSWEEISRLIGRDPGAFTVWLRHYFREHGADIRRLASEAALG